MDKQIMLLEQLFLCTLLANSWQLTQNSTAPLAITVHLQASAGELFTYKIEPQLFNWTHQVHNQQFRYRPSLQSYPDLPSWLRYMYSHEYHAGYLYGTPPLTKAGKFINLDIVALNRKNYQTRRKVLSIFVAHKYLTPNVVQMKIDNLNWVHLMDPGRVENLRNIYRNDLWPASINDLVVVFMESAINMGGRLPLPPHQREGVIVHLGSRAKFSTRLEELQEEVRPLYKLNTCTYKRTSVQKLFENAGFKLDWCAFKIVSSKTKTELLYHSDSTDNVSSTHAPDNILNAQKRWQGMARADVPSRNYIDEFAFAFAIPGVILAILLGLLSIILCFQHEKLFDPHGEFFFENIFHICEESCALTEQDSNADNGSITSLAYPSCSTVQMVQCSESNTNQPVTTLKNLKDPNLLLDNLSLHSQSPSNSFYQIDTDGDAYVRPKPPPYKSGSLGRAAVNI